MNSFSSSSSKTTLPSNKLAILAYAVTSEPCAAVKPVEPAARDSLFSHHFSSHYYFSSPFLMLVTMRSTQFCVYGRLYLCGGFYKVRVRRRQHVILIGQIVSVVYTQVNNKVGLFLLLAEWITRRSAAQIGVHGSCSFGLVTALGFLRQAIES